MSFSSLGYIQRDPFAGLKGSAEKGASGSSSSPTSLSSMFGASAANSPIYNVSAFSVDPSRGPISILSGQPAPELPTAHNAEIASGSNAGANIQAAQNASGKLGQVDEAKANFAKMMGDVQGPLQAALQQGALDCSLNPQTACNSFMPPPPSSDIVDVALNAGAPGVTTVAEVLNTAPKLTAKQEQQLAARVSVLLTPTRDAGGQVTKEPAIPNPLVEQQRLAEVEFLKQALRPVEQQPEYIAMLAVEEKLENAVADHQVQNPTDQAVVKVAQEVGIDVAAFDAQAGIAEADLKNAILSNVLAGQEIKGAKGMGTLNTGDISALLRNNNAAANEPAFIVPPPLIAMVPGMQPSTVGIAA